MKICVTSLGDVMYREQKALVIKFKGRRNVHSTSPLNGAYSEKLNYVYNYDGTQGPERTYVFKETTYKKHLKKIAEKLGLKTEFTSGISTSASIDNISIKEESYKGITTTAIVTAGVDINGGRAGDPASFDERDLLNKKKNKFGTINIILEIDVKLPPEALTRALVTCTEAKTAALQELMIGSKYSNGLATGTGTDGNIIISNLDSSVYLTNTGKHSKLGELIGLSVKKAVKEALYKQENCDPDSQHSILKRFERYGITEESLWQKYKNDFNQDSSTKLDFINHFQSINRNNKLVTVSSLIIHLLDEYRWGLLEKTEINEEIEMLFSTLTQSFNVYKEILTLNLYKNNYIKDILSNFEAFIAVLIRKKVKFRV